MNGLKNYSFWLDLIRSSLIHQSTNQSFNWFDPVNPVDIKISGKQNLLVLTQGSSFNTCWESSWRIIKKTLLKLGLFWIEKTVLINGLLIIEWLLGFLFSAKFEYHKRITEKIEATYCCCCILCVLDQFCLWIDEKFI